MRAKLFLAEIILWVSFHLLPAQSERYSGKPIEIDINQALKIKRDFKMSQLVKDVEFISIENNPKCYMLGMQEFSFGPNYIIAAFSSPQPNTTHLVHIFDRKGIYLRSLGREGKGPGEYIPPYKAKMAPNEKFILIVDLNQQKLITYSPEGILLKERRLPSNNHYNIQEIAVDHKGDIYLHVGRPNTPQDNYSSIVKYNSDLEQVQTILNREKNEDQPLTLLRAQLVNGIDQVIFWESYWNTVYYINDSGLADAKYHFNITKNEWPKEYLKDYRLTMKYRDDYLWVSGFYDLPDYLFISTRFKNFSRLVYDKKSGESFALTNPNNCYFPGGIKTDGSIDNDLLGFENFQMGTYVPDQKLLVVTVNTLYMLGGQDPDCIRQKKVLFPEKRDYLLNLAKSSTEEDGHLLIIYHLK